MAENCKKRKKASGQENTRADRPGLWASSERSPIAFPRSLASRGMHILSLRQKYSGAKRTAVRSVARLPSAKGRGKGGGIRRYNSLKKGGGQI